MPPTCRPRPHVPGDDRARRRRTSERATALSVVPAMTLVLLALAGIAVDLTALHGAHRSVHRSVWAAADEGAGVGDGREGQASGRAVIDPEAATRLATAHLPTAQLPG